MFNDNAGTNLPVLDSDCAEQGQDALSSSASASSSSSKRGRPRKTRESKRQPKSSSRTPKREKKEELVELTFFPSSSTSSVSAGPSSSLTSSTHSTTDGLNKEKSPSLKAVSHREHVVVPNLRLGAIKREDSGAVYFDDNEEGEDHHGSQSSSSGSVPPRKTTPRKSPSSADREKRGDRLLDGTGRLKWTPELHHKFELAVKKFGVQTALPTQILHEMNVEGLTRHHISSHLQKFRFEKFGVKRKKDHESPRDDDDQSLHQLQQDEQDCKMPLTIVHSEQEQSSIPYPYDVQIHCSSSEEYMHPPLPSYYSPSPLDSPSSFFPDPMGLYRLQDEYANKDYFQAPQSDQQQMDPTKSRFNRPSGCTKPLLEDPSQNPSGLVFPVSFSSTASTSSASSSTTTTTTVVRRRCSTGTTPLSKTMPSLVVQKPKPKRLSQSARLLYPPPPPPTTTETPFFSSQSPPGTYEQQSSLPLEHQQQQVYSNAPSSNNPFQAENLFDTSSHTAFSSTFADPQKSPSSFHGFPSGNLATTTLSRTSSSSSSSRETITQTYHHHHQQHQPGSSLPTFPSSSFSSFTDRSSPFSNFTPSPSFAPLEAFPSSLTSTRDSSSSSSSSSSSRPATPSSLDPVFPSYFSSSAHHQQHQPHHNNSSLPPYYEPNLLGQLQQQQFFNPSQPSSSPYFDQTQQFFQHNYGSFYASQDDPMTGPVVTVTGAHTVGGQVSSSLSSTTSSTKSHGETLTNSLLTTFGTSHSSSDQTMLSPVFSPSPGTPFSRSRSPSPSPQPPQNQNQNQSQQQPSFVPLPFTSFNSQ